MVTLFNFGVVLLVAKLHPVAWKRNAHSEELLPGPEALQPDWMDGSCLHSVYHCNMALHRLQRPNSVSIFFKEKSVNFDGHLAERTKLHRNVYPFGNAMMSSIKCILFLFFQMLQLITGGSSQANFNVHPGSYFFHFHAVFWPNNKLAATPSPSLGLVPVKSWVCPSLK